MMMMQDNKSDRSFQNIKGNYQRFAPDGGISYSDNQYGEYSRYYDLNYYTTMRAPTIHQLAPLTDSTNLYYLQRGNINLREVVTQEMSFSFSHYDQANKNSLNYNFRISAGVIKDNIVDSLLIDDLNRRTVFLVNADGHKYLNFNGDIRKAYKFKSSELQLSLNGSLNTNKNPGYTNNQFTFSSNLNTYSNASINYTYKAYLAVVLGQSISTYKSKQEAFNTRYSGKNLGTNLSTSYNVTKKLTLNSNISFNNSSSSGAKDINFTIWNASAVYRFLKGNNAELKFSALDLLRQNNSAINYGNANSFTIDYAKRLSTAFKNISYTCADIFDEIKQARNYDVILCTLTLHHFKDDEILNLLSGFRKQAAIGVVINDLHRSRLAYYLFIAVCKVFGLNKMSKDDGLVSILRGFKKNDLINYAEKLNIRKHFLRWRWAFRYQWIIPTI
ncbi:MAG: hypothetical protein EOO85_17400 [Pedobacter sp.]|nr:MAG: hypothetical protein EOO85_17400 [Pedobacter sp.]